MEIHTLSL